MDPRLSSLKDSAKAIISRVELRKELRERARIQLTLLAQSIRDVRGAQRFMHPFNHRFNASAPINTLPSEVLYLVFRPLGEDALHSTPSRVCSHWRTVVLSEPRLWTDIRILTPKQLAAVPILLSRTSSVPVEIHFSGLQPSQEYHTNLPLCTSALIAHAHHIVSLNARLGTLHTLEEICADLLQCPDARLTDLTLATLLRPQTSWLKDAGPPMLQSIRHLSINFKVTDGAWLYNLSSLHLRFLVSIDDLFEMLRCSPRLQSLHLYSGANYTTDVDFDSIPNVPLQELVVQIHRRSSSQILPECFAHLSRVRPFNAISRIAIDSNPMHPGELIAWRMLDSMAPIAALGILSRPGNISTKLTLADTRGWRRQFCVNDYDLMQVFGVLFGNEYQLLRDLQRLAFSAKHWRFIGEIVRSLDLPSLHTVVYELEASHFDPFIVVAPLELTPLSLSSITEVVLALAPSSIRTNQPSRTFIYANTRSSIHPEVASEFVHKPTDDSASMPLLRLMNLHMDPPAIFYPSTPSRPSDNAGRVVECSWDHADDRNSWQGVPDYIVGS